MTVTLDTLVPLLYRDGRPGAARLHITAVDEDGTPVFDGAAHVVAVSNPDGRPVLICVTDRGREVRIPVEVAAPVVTLR